MNAIQITRLQKTEVPAQYQEEEGCVAFQRVKVEYMFYGTMQSDVLDTKILKNGTQVVISGNGFIKDNSIIA